MNKEKDLLVNYYIVAYIDLLGQQELLRELTSLPDKKSAEEIQSFKQTLRDTYGSVLEMRELFNCFYKSFSEKPTIDLSKLTAEQQREFELIRCTPIKFQQFSDSLIIYMSFNADHVKCPTCGIYGIFLAAASTFITCMSLGHPIRGGIDVGLGMEISDDEIYGSALSRAFTLESKIANYPRIIIGEELIHYLKITKKQKATEPCSIAAKSFANECLNLLAEDEDGYPFIDYLGETMKQLIYTENTDVSYIHKAYEKIVACSEKFKKIKNSKLAFRYTLLRNYFEERLPL